MPSPASHRTLRICPTASLPDSPALLGIRFSLEGWGQSWEKGQPGLWAGLESGRSACLWTSAKPPHLLPRECRGGPSRPACALSPCRLPVGTCSLRRLQTGLQPRSACCAGGEERTSQPPDPYLTGTSGAWSPHCSEQLGAHPHCSPHLTERHELPRPTPVFLPQNLKSSSLLFLSVDCVSETCKRYASSHQPINSPVTKVINSTFR